MWRNDPLSVLNELHASGPGRERHAGLPRYGKRLESLPAHLDTGADRTVVTAAAVAALSLVEDGRLDFQGFAGEVVTLPVFLLDVQMHDLPAVTVRAVLGENEPLILLGRDVLNGHRIVLDGPALALEIG